VLFNSYTFMLLFLPATLAGFFAISRTHPRLAALWLFAASVFFYGWWNPIYVPLLLGSIVFNFVVGRRLMSTSGDRGPSRRSVVLAIGISANLLLLCYYKYAGFFAGSSNAAFGWNLPLTSVVLPLGISFFTFTQIAFLVDAYKGKALEPNFVHYGLFVTYFPHLIAGPILHHSEMMPQFGKASTYKASSDNFAVGSTIFLIGLCKKIWLADGLAVYANAVFNDANPGDTLTLVNAWGGALAYTFELYFDFSGYSDMAIGVSHMFGIKLPLNFNSPYKSTNIIEFWRRWHMTLSRFLREYLYIPLGGNRKGAFARYRNLLITMVLGGLWHGAGWTFVIWGALHGMYLALNHAWQALQSAIGLQAKRLTLVTTVAGWALTFVSVVVGWVFFRAPDVSTATAILRAMTPGIGPIPVNPSIYDGLHWRLKAALAPLRVYPEQDLSGAFNGQEGVVMWLSIAFAFVIACFLPNTQQLMCHYDPALGAIECPANSSLVWHPTWTWLLLAVVLFVLGMPLTDQISEFLYYQF
jgi:alginate O-acetyltransferase complex protein AlgI